MPLCHTHASACNTLRCLPSCACVQEAAQQLLPLVVPAILAASGKYAVVGHSLGCWTAFELLLALRKAGERHSSLLSRCLQQRCCLKPGVQSAEQSKLPGFKAYLTCTPTLSPSCVWARHGACRMLMAFSLSLCVCILLLQCRPARPGRSVLVGDALAPHPPGTEALEAAEGP